MPANRTRKDVVATYSLLKVGAWVVLPPFVAVWLIANWFRGGWAVLGGPYNAGFFEAAFGALAGLAIVVVSLLVALSFIFAGGVAIARVGDELVLNYMFSRKRLSVLSRLAVSATSQRAKMPYIESKSPRKVAPMFASQVTIRRSGLPDVNFPTSLLSQNAEVIASRLAALLR